jgi:hypothetical protein
MGAPWLVGCWVLVEGNRWGQIRPISPTGADDDPTRKTGGAWRHDPSSRVRR